MNQNYLNTVVSLKNMPLQNRVLLKRRIIEAETKRKHLLPGTKYNQINNRPSGGNRTRKGRMSNKRTRKNRRK